MKNYMRIYLYIVLLFLGVTINGYSQITYPIKQAAKAITSKVIKTTSKNGTKTSVRYGAKRSVINPKISMSAKSIAALPTSKILSAGSESLCIKYANKFSSAVPRKVKNEIDHYVEFFLVKERDNLMKKVRKGEILTDKEYSRLEELKKMLPKEGRELSREERIKIIDKIDKSIQSITTEIPKELSLDRFVHILLRHTSPLYDKSYFSISSSDELIKGIKDVIKNGNVIKKKCIYYYKTYDIPIGYDKDGITPVKKWLVICKLDDGELISSYPINDEYLSILKKKSIMDN